MSVGKLKQQYNELAGIAGKQHMAERGNGWHRKRMAGCTPEETEKTFKLM